MSLLLMPSILIEGLFYLIYLVDIFVTKSPNEKNMIIYDWGI